MRSIRNHRRGSSYLASVADSATRPFHYRGTANRLLNQTRRQSFLTKASDNVIGGFQYLTRYENSPILSSPPIAVSVAPRPALLSDNKVATKQVPVPSAKQPINGTNDYAHDEPLSSQETASSSTATISQVAQPNLPEPPATKQAITPASTLPETKIVASQSEQVMEHGDEVIPQASASTSSATTGEMSQSLSLHQLLSQLGKKLEQHNFGEQQAEPVEPEREHKPEAASPLTEQVMVPGQTTEPRTALNRNVVLESEDGEAVSYKAWAKSEMDQPSAFEPEHAFPTLTKPKSSTDVKAKQTEKTSVPTVASELADTITNSSPRVVSENQQNIASVQALPLRYAQQAAVIQREHAQTSKTVVKKTTTQHINRTSPSAQVQHTQPSLQRYYLNHSGIRIYK